MLGEEFELGVLWDEYGIVGDVIVGFSMIVYRLLFISSHL
jgi:hypothetical protein